MSKLNNEIRELSMEELDAVGGGSALETVKETISSAVFVVRGFISSTADALSSDPMAHQH